MGLFIRKHDGMPDVGQGDGWTESEWRRAPKKRVKVSDLESTNRGHYLNPKHVARGGSGTPKVVQSGGRYYVADGHHATAAVHARGEKYVTVRVKKAGR